MKPPPFEYFAPTDLTQAIDLLSGSDNARILAGGQSLMAMLNMRYVFPDRIVDLNHISELDFIREHTDAIAIGAMTRQRTLQRSPEIAVSLPLIPKALRHVGHFQTRNRGTLGGSLCQLDPSAELPAIAMAYDATVVAAGPQGHRDIPFAQFPVTYMAQVEDIQPRVARIICIMEHFGCSKRRTRAGCKIGFWPAIWICNSLGPKPLNTPTQAPRTLLPSPK